MSVTVWLRELRTQWFGLASRKRVRKGMPFRRVRPRLEALEDRTLLSNPASTGDLIAAINTANSCRSAATINAGRQHSLRFRVVQ